MKRKIFVLLSAVLLLSGFSACSSRKPMDSQQADRVESSVAESGQSTSSADELSAETDVPSAESGEAGQQDLHQEEEKMEQKEQNQFYITAGETVFTADFADNSSAEAFKGLLAEGPLTVDMHDYGSFEKVGEIGDTLPRNDEQITTGPGDVILYLGTSITIYYDTNSWNFTRLGKIQDVTKEDLLAAFGDGDVTVIFSIEKPE